MAIQTPYPVAIGQTLALYIEAAVGDPSQATDLVAWMKKVAGLQSPVPPESVPAVAELAVTLQTTSPGNNADGSAIKPGFHLRLTAEQTRTLEQGYYMVDLALTVNGDRFVTEPAIVIVGPAVSLPAS